MESTFGGKKIHVVRRQLIKPKNSIIRGRVGDIKVFDHFNPLTGEGKLIDYMPGGDNAISAGASDAILNYLFNPYSQSGAGYTDPATSNYRFPSLKNIHTLDGSISQNDILRQSAFVGIFGMVSGVSGAAAGLTGTKSFLTNVTLGWSCYWPQYNPQGDWGNSNKWYPMASPSLYSISASRTVNSNGGVPSTTWAFTISSTSSAKQYTIDSIVWSPQKVNVDWTGQSNSTTSTAGYWAGVSNAAPTFTPTTDRSQYQQITSTTPTVIPSMAVTAHYVLPYLVTVNPGGAFQFTYTFQGAIN